MGAQQELANAIDEILWEDWDPIGMKKMNGPRDEYSGYVAELFSLVLANASQEEIAKRLEALAEDLCGAPLEVCMTVAGKIISAKQKFIK